VFIRAIKNSNLVRAEKKSILFGLPFLQMGIYLRNISLLTPKRNRMKKFFAIAFVAAFLVACEEKKAETPATPNDTAAVAPTQDTTKKDTTAAAAPAQDTTKKP
jgi:hypothetical protein